MTERAELIEAVLIQHRHIKGGLCTCGHQTPLGRSLKKHPAEMFLSPLRGTCHMADRTLVSILEHRNPEGPYWRLRIERSAAGQPGGLVIIEYDSIDGTLPHQEMCLVVDDLRDLQPALDWANQ